MSDDEGDPFEDLEKDVEGREGDPFETLTAEGDEEERDSETTDSDPLADTAEGNDENPDQSVSNADHTSSEGETSPQADALGGQDEGETEMAAGGTSGMEFGVGRDVDGSPDVATDAFEDVGQREGDPFEGADSAFEEMDVESLDPNKVWEGLESAEARGSVGEASTRTYAEVSKHSFCEQCEYFSEPPNITCSHEGTEIVEFLDMETVRVVDCPIVAERRELKQDE